MTRVLFVDDEPDLEALIRQKFRRKILDGTVSFLFAHDGIEALALLAQHGDVDMVVSDLNMPRMDGLSLLQRLQEADEKLSTIIVSAYGDMANIRTAMNRGAFDFLTKPIDFGDLETTIDKTVRHVEALREARRRQSAAERARASLARYFSPNLAEKLASDGEAVDLGGQRRDVAALFTDISGFTTLVETLEPETLGPLLNEYFGAMADVVFAHDGTLAKIIGDALHILFGAPGEQPDHASRAISCALALDACAQSFRERWRARGIGLGVTRIGLHDGPAIVGNFGGQRFFDYTAYGDTINIAARLEAANKPLGTRICASGRVVEQVDGFLGRPIGELMLRGRAEPIAAFEPVAPEFHDPEASDSYGRAFTLMREGDPEAVAAFAAHVGAHPGDQLATFHLKRLLNGASGVRILLD
ncbi:MAG: response regulator [Alphaproteobacteria bacterium]|nr:response regulator [Alphaproteobacteria bacterium]